MNRPLGKTGGESPYLRVRIPQDMLEAIEKLALADDRTLSNLVRKVLREFIESKRKKGGR